jgi:hypothetical protein
VELRYAIEMVDAILLPLIVNQVGALGFVSDALVEGVELGAGGLVDAGGLHLRELLIQGYRCDSVQQKDTKVSRQKIAACHTKHPPSSVLASQNHWPNQS